MKAIISNGKRTQVFSNQLQFDALKNFASTNFPRMKNPVFKFKDLQGQLISINSNSDIQTLSKSYQGQNFVQILICKEHKGVGIEHKDHQQKNANRIQKRQTILEKIYGGSGSDYQAFVTQNEQLPVGKLIKKFAEVNGILKKKEKKEKKEKSPQQEDRKFERKRKILEKIFGGEEKNKQEYFLKENKDLKLGELIKKYSEINGTKENMPNNEKNSLKKKERILEKLSAVLQKPKQDLVSFVQKNPDSNFRELLKILQKQEGFKIDFAKIKEAKRQQKEQKEHKRCEEHKGHKEHKEDKEDKELNKQQKKQHKAKSQEKKFMEKVQSPEQQHKNYILATMQGIFQTEQPANLMKFIEQNYALGEAGIIQKWLNK